MDNLLRRLVGILYRISLLYEPIAAVYERTGTCRERGCQALSRASKHDWCFWHCPKHDVRTTWGGCNNCGEKRLSS
jgi:hypothetical protein